MPLLGTAPQSNLIRLDANVIHRLQDCLQRSIEAPDCEVALDEFLISSKFAVTHHVLAVTQITEIYLFEIHCPHSEWHITVVRLDQPETGLGETLPKNVDVAIYPLHGHCSDQIQHDIVIAEIPVDRQHAQGTDVPPYATNRLMPAVVQKAPCGLRRNPPTLLAQSTRRRGRQRRSDVQVYFD